MDGTSRVSETRFFFSFFFLRDPNRFGDRFPPRGTPRFGIPEIGLNRYAKITAHHRARGRSGSRSLATNPKNDDDVNKKAARALCVSHLNLGGLEAGDGRDLDQKQKKKKNFKTLNICEKFKKKRGRRTLYKEAPPSSRDGETPFARWNVDDDDKEEEETLSFFLSFATTSTTVGGDTPQKRTHLRERGF